VLILNQFILRMSFGMALAMALTPARLVTSGYYRNNMYVLLGLNVLASLIAFQAPADVGLHLGPPLVAAIVGYLGAVMWLYERPRLGIAALVIVAAVTLGGAWWDGQSPESATAQSGSLAGILLHWLDPVSGGLVLGTTMAAMLLGHWYLNAPGMQLLPLERLVLAIGAAVVLRTLCSGCGLALEVAYGPTMPTSEALMITLRWLSGLLGTSVVAWMSWQTLKIPNTQSATGILYVGVIATFLGELTAQLLSRTSLFPL
jgi:hypothetical protein